MRIEVSRLPPVEFSPRYKAGLVYQEDALVQAQLIPDDTPEHLVMGSFNVVIDQQQAPKTIIDLEEE